MVAPAREAAVQVRMRVAAVRVRGLREARVQAARAQVEAADRLFLRHPVARDAGAASSSKTLVSHEGVKH